MAKRKKVDQNFDNFGSFYERFVNYTIGLTPVQRNNKTIVGLVIVAALATLSSIHFIKAEWFLWVEAIVGFPGGVILFAILVSLVKTTKMGDSNIFRFKEKNSHAQRIRTLAVFVVIIIIIMLFVGKFLPYGVGGIIMIAVALTIYNLLRRTPQEITYAKLGVVDPRDIKREESE